MISLSRALWIRLALALVFSLAVVFFVSPLDAFAQGAAVTTDRPTAKVSTCGVLSPMGCFNEYFLEPILTMIATVFMSMGAGILKLCGFLFDTMFYYVVIDFAGTLKNLGIMPWINTAWTFFRDLANIMIIGIFVFIAISLILGLKEYGQKKLVARVLLIAVLMNFSLLFAKITIDASNFIAYSIYKSSLEPSIKKISTGAASNSIPSVSDKFLTPMRLTSFFDNRSVAAEIAKHPSGGPYQVLLFGFFMGILLMIIGVVLLYGTFLFISRSILLIFLMMIAPMAFASYLAPNLENTAFGWKNWWKALINNAVFAPLMIMFLVVSIKIVESASSSGMSGASYGAVIGGMSSESVGGGWQILFLYVISVGLLFTSFRMSSSFAGSISGINLGQMTTALPFVGASMFGSKLAQYSIGKRAAGAANTKGAELQRARMDAFRSGKVEDWARVEKLREQKSALEKKSSRTFNPMNSFLGKTLAKSTGLKDIGISGETKSSFASDMQDKAKKAEPVAKAMQITREDKAEVRKEAEKAAIEASNKDMAVAEKKVLDTKQEVDKAEKNKESIENERKAADQQVDQNKKQKEPEIEREKTIIKETEAARGATLITQEKEMASLVEKAAKATGAAREQADLEIETVRASHKEAITEQDNRIDGARKQIDKLDKEIQAPHIALEDRIAAAQKQIEERKHEHDIATKTLTEERKNQEKKVKDAGDEAVKDLEAAAKRTVPIAMHDLAVKTAGISGGTEGAHIVEHHFEEKFKSKSNPERIADIFKEMRASTEKTDDKK